VLVFQFSNERIDKCTNRLFSLMARVLRLRVFRHRGGVFVSIFILFPGCVYISLLQKLNVTGIFTILAEGTCYARGVP
jgi:hypothetical protein